MTELQQSTLNSARKVLTVLDKLEALLGQQSANEGVLREGLAAAIAEIYRLWGVLEEERVDRWRAEREIESAGDSMMRFHARKRKAVADRDRYLVALRKAHDKLLRTANTIRGITEAEEVIREALTIQEDGKPMWDGETCDRCGRDQRLGWAVKDECWNRVVPEKLRMNVLCLECFFEIADEGGHDIRLEDFICLVVATVKDLEMPTFVDEEPDRSVQPPAYEELSEGYIRDVVYGPVERQSLGRDKKRNSYVHDEGKAQ